MISSKKHISQGGAVIAEPCATILWLFAQDPSAIEGTNAGGMPYSMHAVQWCSSPSIHVRPSTCHADGSNISRICSSAALRKKQRQSFSARKFEKLMTKKKKKFYFDPVNAGQLGKISSNTQLSRRNDGRLQQQDSVRLRVYNTILYQHIVDLVNTDYISKELEELQVPILSVRMAGDMSVARVYWQASGNAESDDKVQEVLDRYVGQIRHALISLRVFGKVPRVCFLQDKAAASIAEIDRLLATADLGPGDDEDTSNDTEPLTSKWNDPHGESAAQVELGLDHLKRGGQSKPTREESQIAYGGPNYFAVDHADALAQISRGRQKDEKMHVPEGFSPITTDSLEQFKKFQKRKKARRRGEEDQSVYRGQLDERGWNDGEELLAHENGDENPGDASGESDFDEDEAGYHQIDGDSETSRR
ncbi:putative ribosome-binding factor A, mitochondrial [Diadema antillarum]|uniref:putative ribosome-binding factor A, mitochondrial n=1 Tax=Diadema antillarum TaxID=105358 RepID=UPI003A8B87B8